MAQPDLANLYAKHRQGLFTQALLIARCAERAEDAIHDAFARLCRVDLTAVGDPVAYAFAAVRAAAIDQVRRARRGEHAIRQRAASLFLAPPEDGEASVERVESVTRALDSLAPEQREVVVLRVYAGLSFAQIAQVMDEPLQTVASRYRRSLERLREHLEKLV